MALNDQKSWFKRLKEGLNKTSSSLTQGIVQIFTHKKLDAEVLESLEDLLISADVGLNVTDILLKPLRTTRLGTEISEVEIREILATGIIKILKPFARPLPNPKETKPFVVLIVGVNGSGKTTTIAKIAHLWKDQGLRPMLVAGDTFRAGAREQLKIWADRLDIPILLDESSGGDSAALCFEGLERARKEKQDILILDTAGRLHTNTNLMDELEKIRRVLKKIDASAPHLTLLVIDATIGQNAYVQVAAFQEKIKIDGLIITKLDGTAKGGVVIGLTQKFEIPIYAIGCGEAIDDLRPFRAEDFAHLILGLDENTIN